MIGGLVTLGLVVLAGYGMLTRGDDNNASTVTSSTVAGEATSVFDLRVGTCFNGVAEGVLMELPVVSCIEPHDFEVYHQFTVEDEFPRSAPFPGEDAVFAHIERCVPVFEEFVGVQYADSALEVGLIYPTEDSWRLTDREFLCYLFELSGAPMTGSAEGTGR